MKTKLATACAAALLMVSGAQAFDIKEKQGDVDKKLKIYGFYQLNAWNGDGNEATGKDALRFGADRVRWGMNYSAGNLGAKLFLDFNQNHEGRNSGGVDMSSMMKDAFVFYKFDKALTVKAGLIKMPHGMGFTIPGWNLDIAERSFDKQMSLERNVGLMLSGRAIGGEGKVNGFEMGHERPMTGFGYDIMIANPAGRSGAVKAGSETPNTGYTANKGGYSNSYAVRGMYDMGELLHAEVSYALSPYAGGITLDTNGDLDDGNVTEDYTSVNFGIDSHMGPLNVKFEMYDSKNIDGIKDYNERTMALTGTYALSENLEVAAKHVQGDAEKEVSNKTEETTLTNTYLGLNIYMSPVAKTMSRSDKRKRNAHKVVVNYIMAGGDTEADANGNGKWNGKKGHTENLMMAQYQVKF